MRFCALLGVAITALSVTSASAAMVITADEGGSMSAYAQRFGKFERLSYSFDVDRPLFIGGGQWRK